MHQDAIPRNNPLNFGCHIVYPINMQLTHA